MFADPYREAKARSMPDHRTILVVDDEVDILDFVTDTLSEAAYTVRTARDGESALAAVADQSPDLILLDLLMPRMDGYAVLAHLRHNSLEHIPVVVMSANRADPQELRARGASAFLPKPFDLDELLDCVDRYIRLR